MASEIRTVVDDVIDETAEELLRSQQWQRRLKESHPGVDPESDEAKKLAHEDAIKKLGLY